MSYALSERGAAAAGELPGTRVWRSVGARVAAWYVVVTLAAFAVVASVVAVRADSWVQREATRSAERTLDEYRRALDERGVDGVRALAERAARDGASVAVRIVEHEIEIFEVASDHASERAAVRMRAEAHGARHTSSWPKREWQLAAAHASRGRVVEVVVRDDTAAKAWAEAKGDVLFVVSCALGCAVLGAFVISRRALAPLGDLARAADGIVRSGDLSRRVHERGGGDELDRLAALFNRMLARNETLVRTMRESLDNVAHDLRTPLTRLRTGAEVALRQPSDPARLGDALADVIEETERVLGMLTALMDIAEAETGAMRLDARPEDLGTIAREAVDFYDLVSAERGVRVITRFSPGVRALVDRRRILQVLSNLLDNAIKYTRPGGHVEIEVTSDADVAVVRVRDNGIGIAPEDRARVWDRLFRADRSRSERGLGLGLALVRAVVRAHGGDVALESELGEGSTFEVRLPRAR